MSRKKGIKGVEFTEERLLEAVAESHGIFQNIANKLGCDRKTVERALKKYPKFKQLVDDASESALDHTESKLFEKIDEGNVLAIFFHLHCKGKKRGWIEKQTLELEGPVCVGWIGEKQGKKNAKDRGPV
ncbi:MAG: hypothetical protein EHM49_10440 [Deltaproteobacteria bacterium]|nr:MAG: hypothetical protein EHM49_10440 [Deltaproteobacteria bacterium]